MKLCRSVLAALLVLVMAITPVFGVLHIQAAEALEITGVSGDASGISLTTNLPYSALTLDPMPSYNLSQYPATSLSNLSQDSNGYLVLELSYDKGFSAGQFYALYADSSLTNNGITYSLGQDYFYQYNGTSWSVMEKTGDILTGYGFEEAGNELNFSGIADGQAATIERVSYADANVTAPANGGSYALKVSHASNCWPNFRVDFGKTLKTGTTITFDVYGNYDYVAAEGVNKFVKLELTADSKNFATSADSNQIVWTLVETWKTATITLTADSDHVDFFYNVADGQHGEVPSWLLMDNIKAVEPGTEPEETEPVTEPTPVGDICEGYGFEVDGNELYFTGITEYQAATIERVSYADANVAAPANGGSYALKVSHASNCWPNFRLDFGKTLAAGTTITFDVYGNYDYVVTDGGYKYMKLELTADSKNFATSADSNQIVWTLVETWKTGLTITLTADSDHVELFYNVADGQHGDVSSWLLMDNFKAVEPGTEPEETEPDVTEPTPVGDIWEGYGFEVNGNQWYFDAVGGDCAGRDATFEVVSYGNTGIVAPQNGGSYALRLTHESNKYPTFRLNFSETLSAGTVITFDAYTRDTSNASNNTLSIFEYVSGGEATAEYFCNSWNKLTILLKSDCDYIDLFCNIDRYNRSGSANAEVYLDNFKAVKIEPFGDILDGYGFENSGNAGYFAGQGLVIRDATIERAEYSALGIEAPANGGSYALKLSNPSNRWPTFRIDFGKTLHAGAEISFDVYCKVNGANGAITPKFEFTGDSGSGDATTAITCGEWTRRTIKLTSAADHIDLFWNIDNTALVEPYSSEIYLDNIIASDPEAPVGDILEGYGFEVDGNERFFSGVGGANAWRDATFKVVSFDGDNALKLTCAASQWPTFRFDFGRTLRAGTVITFDAFTRDTSGARNNVSIFEEIGGCNVSVVTDSNGATDQYSYNSWKTLTITLATDANHIDLFCNMDRWSELGPANLEVYIDNVKAEQPPVGDIWEGYGFEVDGNELYFTGTGDTTGDTAVDRVAYGDINVAAPANNGEYALEVSHESSCWPNFHVDFGETLKAGTIITFDVYGNYDYAAAEGVTKYIKLELSAGSKNFATTADPNQVLWTVVETWRTGVSITLTADSDHVDLFYNVADSQHGNVASYILIDNVRAHDPAEAVKENEVAATCTAEGSYDSVVYCDHCGIELSRVQNTVPALGHTYVGTAAYVGSVPTITYNCSVCGQSEHKIELDFYGSTVYMGNTLAVYYYTESNIDGIKLSETETLPGFTDISVNFSYGERKVHYDEDGNVANDYSLKVALGEAITNDARYYKFPCRYITPSQIGDEITAVISGKFGEETFTFTMDGYSVKQYCLNRLSNSTSDTEKAMLVDMLYYCDASRAFTTYKADEDAVSEKLSSAQKALHTAERTYNSVLNKAYKDITDEKATWTAAAIDLYDCVRIRLRFEAAEGVDVSKLTAKAIVDNKEMDAYVVQKDGAYYVYVVDLAYAQLSVPVYVTLYEGATAVSDTISYSVESYVATMLNDSNAELVTLIKKMMCYGDSAKAYFDSKN